MIKTDIIEGIVWGETEEFIQINFPKEMINADDIEKISQLIINWHNQKKPPLLRKKKILIVDDFGATRSAVKHILVNELHATDLMFIREAENGKDAFEILEEDKEFDLIISDWNMPQMSGFELLQKVKNDDQLKKIPFVMLTSEGDAQQVKKAIVSGVSNYILKPFTTETFQQKLQKINFL